MMAGVAVAMALRGSSLRFLVLQSYRRQFWQPVVRMSPRKSSLHKQSRMFSSSPRNGLLKQVQVVVGSVFAAPRFWFIKHFVDSSLDKQSIFKGAPVALSHFLTLAMQRDYTNMKGLVTDEFIEELIHKEGDEQLLHRHQFLNGDSRFIIGMTAVRVIEKSSGKYISVKLVMGYIPKQDDEGKLELIEIFRSLTFYDLELHKKCGTSQATWVIAKVKLVKDLFI